MPAVRRLVDSQGNPKNLGLHLQEIRMREPTSVHDERDRRGDAASEGRPEAASSCTEIGVEDEMKWPLAELIGTAIFVMVVCLGAAALVAWIA